MADLYTVTLQGSSDLVLKDTSVSWRPVERRHRNDAHPPVLVRSIYEVEIRGTILDGATSVALVTSLGTLIANYVDKRVVPTYVKIRDDNGDPLDEVGDIDLANDWENLHFTAFDLPGPHELDDSRQFVSKIEYRLVLRADRVFPDDDGIVEFDPVYEQGSIGGGLKFRQKVTELTLSQATSNVVTTAAILAQVRLAKPNGWVRVAPSNDSDGIHVTYPDGENNKKRMVVTSRIEQLGPGSSAATGTEGHSLVEERREDPGRGVVEVLTRARYEGTDQALTQVQGHRPGGDVGTTTDDSVLQSATGDFRTLETLGLQHPKGPKLTRVTPRRVLEPGGVAHAVTRFVGNVTPRARAGIVEPFYLTESLDLWALGIDSVSDIPLVDAPQPEGDWVPIQGWVDELPAQDVVGRSQAQHLAKRSATRRWVWQGAGDPRENSSFQAWLLQPFEPDRNP